MLFNLKNKNKIYIFFMFYQNIFKKCIIRRVGMIFKNTVIIILSLFLKTLYTLIKQKWNVNTF